MRTSTRSYFVALAGLGAVGVIRTLLVLAVGGQGAAVAIADIGEALVVFAAAVLALVFAGLLREKAARAPWTLVATGVLAFAAGDALWAVLELGTGNLPYPGMPDIFYFLSYVFLCSGILLAAYRLRDEAEVPNATLIAGLTVAVGLAALMFTLIGPLLLPAGLETAELGMGVAYPIADIVLLVGPAVFITALAFQAGQARAALPWAGVLLGVVTLTVTNAAFSWLSAYGLYSAGSLVDYGWMISQLMIAVAASLALDADSQQAPARRPAEEPFEAARRPKPADIARELRARF